MVATMGEMVEFEGPAGNPATGYLAMAEGAGAPGVVVIQEWWGLIDQIKGVCDRLAAKEMMSLQLDTAAQDMSGAVELLRARTGRRQVGVIGFCMGGGLALVLAAQRSDAIAAVIPCYGVHPWESAHPDYTDMTAATQIHCAGQDDFFTPAAAEELAGTLGSLGKEVELHVYPASQHAFFNEDRPEVFDAEASALLWRRAVDFLRAHLPAH